MALTKRDLFYMVARAACFCMGVMSYFIMASVRIYNLHWVFMSIVEISPFPSMWNFTWLLIHVGAICLGLEQMDTNYLCIVLTDWLITGFTMAPAWAAVGLIMYYEFDTKFCDSTLRLSQMCSRIQLAVGLYLVSGTVNLVIALVKTWEFALLFPSIVEN